MKCVGSRFHVLRYWTCFRRYRWHWVPFSCFSLPDPFWVVLRAPNPVFIFCAHRLVLGGTKGARFRFHVLRSLTHFRRYRGRRVLFSCFALPDLFSEVPKVSGPVCIFCARGLGFDDTEGVGFRFHVLRSQTHFRWSQGRRVPFSCFMLPYSFWVVPRALGPVLMFCAPGPVLGDTKGARSSFHLLRSRTRFERYRGRHVPFSCFALSYSFSPVPRASGLVFMFCALVLIFDGTEGVGSRFHVLRSRTRFRRYREHRFPFSCFALPDPFSAVPRALGPVFMFCAPRTRFGGTEGVGSRFHILCFQTCFGW
jgi:hypothetical protein